jgi:hypothetical protein
MKPYGTLLVFEVSPVYGARFLQRQLWDVAKQVLKRNLDAYFWTPDEITNLIRSEWPTAKIERNQYAARNRTLFPPVINLPWLKIPRALYPFTVNAFRVTNT